MKIRDLEVFQELQPGSGYVEGGCSDLVLLTVDQAGIARFGPGEQRFPVDQAERNLVRVRIL